MTTLASILSGLSFFMSIIMLLRLKMPQGFYVLPLKMMAVSLSPLWAIMGVLGAVIGWFYRAYWVIPMGIIGAGAMIVYIWRVTRGHNGFEKAFGAGWSDQIPPEQARRMLKTRWAGYLKMKASPEPSWERDIAFWTIPGTDRQLLCDVWSPANGDISGLVAFNAV